MSRVVSVICCFLALLECCVGFEFVGGYHKFQRFEREEGIEAGQMVRIKTAIRGILASDLYYLTSIFKGYDYDKLEKYLRRMPLKINIDAEVTAGDASMDHVELFIVSSFVIIQEKRIPVIDPMYRIVWTNFDLELYPEGFRNAQLQRISSEGHPYWVSKVEITSDNGYMGAQWGTGSLFGEEQEGYGKARAGQMQMNPWLKANIDSYPEILYYR